jgi:YVTN family beta-propeller protein
MTARTCLVSHLPLLVLAMACSSSTSTDNEGPPGQAVRLAFTADTFTLRQAGAATLRARAYDATGRVVEGVAITYSATGNAATVSNAGQVLGVKPGVGGITATADGLEISATLEVFGHPEGVIKGSTPLADRPFGVAVSRNGLVYVTRLDAAKVSSLDTALTLGDSIDVGATPTGVAFSPDGQTGYVTNQFSNSLGVIDVSGAAQASAITIPASPFVPFVSPDGERVFVTSNTSNVYLIDRASGAVTDSIELTHAPNGFALHPDEVRVYVSAFVGGTVSEIAVNSGNVLRTFTPGGTPQDMVVSADGTELYVANENGWVEIFDLASGNSVKKVTLTSGGFGMALSPDQQHLYVSEPGAGVVEIVNLASRTVIHTLDVGGIPRRIAFTRHGGVAVIPNEFGYVSFVR